MTKNKTAALIVFGLLSIGSACADVDEPDDATGEVLDSEGENLGTTEAANGGALDVTSEDEDGRDLDTFAPEAFRRRRGGMIGGYGGGGLIGGGPATRPGMTGGGAVTRPGMIGGGTR